MISGFIIMVDRPFRIGDRIQLTSHEVGDVVEIGLRSTKIRTLDNTILVVPNAELVGTRVINQAYPDERLACTLKVAVAYGSDVKRVKGILEETARAIPQVLKDPPPAAYLAEFGDFSCNIVLSY